MGDDGKVWRATTCPETSLPIHHDAAWANVALTSDYRATFCLVGKRIVLTYPEGPVGEQGMPQFLARREAFLREHDLWENPHVELKDYSAVDGAPPRAARNLFIDFLVQEVERGKLLGVWGFDAPTLVRWMFNFGRKLNPHPVPTLVVQDYADAMKHAMARLAEMGVKPD